MKTIQLILFAVLFGTTTMARELPNKTEILNTLTEVNDYWISTSPETSTNRHLSVKWSRAAYFSGHMELYKIYPHESYWDYGILWGNNNNWQLGQNKNNDPRHADNQCVGQAYMDLYQLNGSKDEYMLEAIKGSVKAMVESNKKDDWNWVDALYMAMPVFSRLGTMLQDAEYHNALYELYHDTKVTRRLYDTSRHLWYRDANFLPPHQTSNGKKTFWSRGNGWAFGAHVRTLIYLPENDPHRAEYLTTFKEMAAALIEVQREDGFWNVNLADDQDYPGPETSGTSFFLYGLAWGVNNGHLDAPTYMPAIKKAWNGLVTIAKHQNGKLGYIQGIGSQPSSSQPVTYNSMSDYGIGAFLLAGTELLKMAEGEMPTPPKPVVTTVYAVDAEDGSYPATNLFDGIVDDDHSWRTNIYPQTVIIDYGETKPIEGTKVYTTQGRSYHYTIDISNSPTSGFVNVVDQSGPTSSQPIEHNFAQTNGRYVKLVITGATDYSGNEIGINELEIVEHKPIEITIESVDEEQPPNFAANMLDGIQTSDSRWSAKFFPKSVVFDLGRNAAIIGTNMWTYQSRNYQYKIETSNSPDKDFTLQVDKTNDTSTRQPLNTSFSATARYLKLTVTGSSNYSGDWTSINEFEIQIDPAGTSTANSTIGSNGIAQAFIYPNPASNLVHIAGLKEGKYQITVYDIQGRKYGIHKYSSNNAGFSIAHLPKGLYVLKISQGSCIVIKKFIKN